MADPKTRSAHRFPPQYARPLARIVTLALTSSITTAAQAASGDTNRVATYTWLDQSVRPDGTAYSDAGTGAIYYSRTGVGSPNRQC